MRDQKPELLSPAGSYKSVIAAVEAGADAVYASGKRFGARACAENLGKKELAEAIDFVHLHGKKLYLTVNILLKDQEMDELFNYLLPYYEQGLDAVIVQDVGVLYFLRHELPDLPVHISTQMTVTNADGVSFFAEQGASRVILARELSLAEIRRIRQEVDISRDVPDVELECFIHGALCYCYSGQCLLSSMIGGRSGNRGQCAQPCRLSYMADGGKMVPLLSMKDLCTLEHLPDLTEAGIDSFKIEGRMKQPDYVYTVTSIYRKYLDLCIKLKKDRADLSAYHVEQEDKKRLKEAYQRRGYTDGYLYRKNGREMISFARPERSGAEEERSEKHAEKYTKNETDLQEKINGKLMLSAGSRAKLYLECGDIHVTCMGDVAEAAKNQPLKREQIEKQMRKTGGTPFVFQDLALDISGQIFMPIQALNSLRREGLETLQKAMLSRFLRAPVENQETKPGEGMDSAAVSSGPELEVLVSTYEQFQAAAASGKVSRIYVDAEIGFQKETVSLARKCQADICLAMPYVFREGTRERFGSLYESLLTCYDGVLVRSWDAYAWLVSRGYQASHRIAADQNLYVFNKQSIRFFRQVGLNNWTAPAELNEAELKELGIERQALAVYGYQPVMISAGCILNTTKGCVKDNKSPDHAKTTGQWIKLRDASNHTFAVKNVCSFCYNVIYNGVPLMLLDEATEILKMQPRSVRLDFTAETKAETEKLIEEYADGFLLTTGSNGGTKKIKPAMPANAFTRGHFRRGVT